MKTSRFSAVKLQPGPPAESDLLILSDGRVLAHNLTPALAAVLAELTPEDTLLTRCARGIRRGKADKRRP